MTKSSVTGWKENPGPETLVLSSGRSERDTSGKFSASLLPTLTKKKFKEVAMDLSEVTTAPSTRRLEIFLELFDEGKVFLSAFQNSLAFPWLSRIS